jgi:hypothetical protein
VSSSKEAELVAAVLLYAVRCLAEGDQPALAAMNFGPREVDALKGLTLADFCRLGSLQAHCLRATLNREVFWSLVEYLERERRAETVQLALIEADAPLEMMRALFGISSREYTRLRRWLGVTPVVGRPPEPEEAVAEAVWAAWPGRALDRNPGQLSPEIYLDIHRATGASLRAIWVLTRRWAADARDLDQDTGATDRPASEPPVLAQECVAARV